MGAIWTPLVRLEEIMGREAAHKLARACGGQSLYVPHLWRRAKALLALVGPDATKALCREYGGTDVLLPSALLQPETKKVRLVRLFKAGLTPLEACRQTGATLRYAQQVRADLGL